MGREAGKLLKAMAEAGEEHLAIWPKKDIIRHLIGSVAVAVQRGGAMAYLEGHYKALNALGRTLEKEEKKEEVEEAEEEEEEEDVGKREEEEEDEDAGYEEEEGDGAVPCAV